MKNRHGASGSRKTLTPPTSVAPTTARPLSNNIKKKEDDGIYVGNLPNAFNSNLASQNKYLVPVTKSESETNNSIIDNKKNEDKIYDNVNENPQKIAPKQMGPASKNKFLVPVTKSEETNKSIIDNKKNEDETSVDGNDWLDMKNRHGASGSRKTLTPPTSVAPTTASPLSDNIKKKEDDGIYVGNLPNALISNLASQNKYLVPVTKSEETNNSIIDNKKNEDNIYDNVNENPQKKAPKQMDPKPKLNMKNLTQQVPAHDCIS
jgi:hypothetical protein